MRDTTIAALALVVLVVLIVAPSVVQQWRYRRARAQLRARLMAELGLDVPRG